LNECLYKAVILFLVFLFYKIINKCIIKWNYNCYFDIKNLFWWLRLAEKT
jgi:hypothetical protein